MFLRQGSMDKPCNKVEENIKKDLIATLQRKGINISKVQISMKSGNLNVEVVIDEK